MESLWKRDYLPEFFKKAPTFCKFTFEACERRFGVSEVVGFIGED